MKNQRGLGLIGILIVIGTLIITAGGVVALPASRRVWERMVSLNPTVSVHAPSDVVSKKDTLIEKRVSVKGYARRAAGPCTGVYTLDCNHCPGSIVLSTTQKGKLKSLDAIYGCHYPTEEYDRAIWLLKESQNLLSFRCIGSGLKPNCIYQCPSWELGVFYQVTGIWKQDDWGRYFLEVISKQNL